MNQVDPAERGIAMVFQSYALYPHMTVEENMGFGLRVAQAPRPRSTSASPRRAQDSRSSTRC